MSQETIISNTEVSFKDFLFKNKRNRTILWIAAAAIVIQFAVFKYFYPFASFIHGDSFVYIETAHYNLNINTYMVGYSRFLRFFSVFSKSDTILVAFQYLTLQASALFLLFTLFYLYNPAKITRLILIGFIILNPLFLHLSNLISSDCLFTSLSLTWFGLLFWLLHKPSQKIILLQTLVLFIAFTFRYNALLYPLLFALVLYFSPMSLLKKATALSISAIMCGAFIFYTSYNYKKLTGTWQYSPFSGWQLANNAMYAYRYVDSSSRKPVANKFKELDQMIRTYFDSTRDVKKFPIESAMASTFYMWSPRLPLMKYAEMKFKNKPNITELNKWASMGPLYKSYGLDIIKKYPWHFIKFYIWPNANKYYAPPVEFLDTYNSGSYKVTQLTKRWFDYNSEKVSIRFKSNKIWILNFYPFLSSVMNVVMACCLFCYFTLKGWQYHKSLKFGILLSGSVWLLNAGFTIFASSPALRFQASPILLTTIFSLIILEWLIKLARSNSTEEKIDFEITHRASLNI